MPKSNSERIEVRGTVRSLNTSPRGTVEGAIVETPKGVVQVNLPKHDDGGAPATLVVGKRVTLSVRGGNHDGEHPIYELAGSTVTVQGRIAQLNYARHGEVNGVQLEDGTFIHLKPEGAKKHRLKVGDLAVATGRRTNGPHATVVDAATLLIHRSTRAKSNRAA